MALSVRRVITGHDGKGKAIVKLDEVAKHLAVGRPGATVSIATSSPSCRISAAIAFAISCSPGAPATSVGLTELIATRSRSRRIAGSM